MLIRDHISLPGFSGENPQRVNDEYLSTSFCLDGSTQRACCIPLIWDKSACALGLEFVSLPCLKSLTGIWGRSSQYLETNGGAGELQGRHLRDGGGPQLWDCGRVSPAAEARGGCCWWEGELGWWLHNLGGLFVFVFFCFLAALQRHVGS